jgi:hypothetical protein
MFTLSLSLVPDVSSRGYETGKTGCRENVDLKGPTEGSAVNCEVTMFTLSLSLVPDVSSRGYETGQTGRRKNVDLKERTNRRVSSTLRNHVYTFAFLSS